MSDAQRLTELIERAMQNIAGTQISISDLSPEYQALGDTICQCLQQMQEIYCFTDNISDGDISVPVPPRHNYMAAAIKDLYYKFNHLAWQAEQVAHGDYSQRVDFMGSFSTSFNLMINDLSIREQTIRQQAEEQVLVLKEQNRLLQMQLNRQISNYESYRLFTESYQSFRKKYKEMMGKVYDLFSQGEYDEGRLLVAKINDLMGSDIDIHRQYSDYPFLDSVLMDLSNYCRSKGIQFDGMIHVPQAFQAEENSMREQLVHFSTLLFSLVDIEETARQSLTITGSMRDGWLTISADYCVASKDFWASNKALISLDDANPVYQKYVERLQISMEQCNNFFDVQFRPALCTASYVLHFGASCPGKSAIAR